MQVCCLVRNRSTRSLPCDLPEMPSEIGGSAGLAGGSVWLQGRGISCSTSIHVYGAPNIARSSSDRISRPCHSTFVLLVARKVLMSRDLSLERDHPPFLRFPAQVRTSNSPPSR